MTPGAVAAPGPGDAAGRAPPFVLPGEHFAAALLFLVAGAAGLAWMAPGLAAGAFPDPRIIGVAHLFTLGWLTTSIMGALYQFLPVALGTPIRSVGLAHVTFWLYVPGVAAFVGGLAAGIRPATVAGSAALSVALLLFLGNLAATLARSPRRNVTWWSVAGAGFFLFATLGLGLVLVANLRSGVLGDLRFMVVGVHLHVAAGGWVLLTIVGVAHRLLPMFLLSHGAREVSGRAAAGLLAGGALLLLLTHHALGSAPLLPGGLLLGAGVGAFLHQAALHFTHRKRPVLDPGLRLVAVSLGILGVALVMALAQLVSMGTTPRVATAYVAALVVGGLGLFVAGHYYKIVPFLTWFHRFAPVAAEREVPRVGELFDHRVAHGAVALLAVGAAGVVAGIVAGAAAATRVAALLLTAGAVVEAGQMLRLFGRRP